MKKLILWILALSTALAAFITALVIIILWLWLGKNQIEFELQTTDIILMLGGIDLVLFICLFIVFYKPIIDVKKLLSENPFSDIYSIANNGFNPFIAIKKIIKKNNDKSN
ncbi:MAG: hypothetical protein ACKVQB_08715, partial [Bacteroidia bacterium]